ncbi:MAG: WecB/TagA/CpsF family glycosyltransferase [Candidatus Heimdallarchaeota archaeon]|nr:WecB/TagA/CpsF family glycosyltransferase [Candidatus Heimdallarchaeota archaeon]
MNARQQTIGKATIKNKERVLNTDIDNITLREILGQFKSGFVVTPNADVLVQLQTNKQFYEIYQTADYVLVDSKVVMLAARVLGIRFKEKISGSDFLPAYCQYHKANTDVRIFLLGGKEDVANLARENINKKIGREIIVGSLSPSMNFSTDDSESMKAIETINKSGANVLAVGLGSPKQEMWISKYRNKLENVHSFMSVGATLDFEAGTLSRAPRWMSNIGLEWFYRLAMEPRRLWRRYLMQDTKLFWYIFLQAIGYYKNPFNS